MHSSTSNSEAKQRFYAIAWQFYCRLFARNKLNDLTFSREDEAPAEPLELPQLSVAPAARQEPRPPGDSSNAATLANKTSNLRGTLASVAFLGIAVLTYLYLEHKAQRFNADIALRESREEQDAEWHDIIEAGKQPASKARMLVLGNSLLLRGVQFDKVKDYFSPTADAKRLVVVNTNYFDWYYTMLRLFNEGARADVVVLVLTPKQLAASYVREDFFAHHLMRLRDIFSIARDLKLSNTDASSLAFANLSQYYDLRAKIRNKQLVKIFSNLGPLMSMLIVEPPPSKKLMAESVAAERLQALRDLAAQWNAKFVLVMPPADGGKEDPNTAVVQAAGRRTGIPVLLPIAPGVLAADHYMDGFHLNKRGAEAFTSKFITALQQEAAVYTALKESTTATIR